jgi:hypothetical protein
VRTARPAEPGFGLPPPRAVSRSSLAPLRGHRDAPSTDRAGDGGLHSGDETVLDGVSMQQGFLSQSGMVSSWTSRSPNRGERPAGGGTTNEPPRLTPEKATAHAWRPDPATGEAMKKRSTGKAAVPLNLAT